jgi:serine/threonine-protein kinase
VRQVLAALRYAHRNGIIHRDIKPHNVIVDHEGRVKVADFGIARAGTSQITEAGSIIGTAQYLSPEQARGAPVDESSDLYSTGIVLYELLTGTVPFTGESPVEIAMKHLSQPPAPPSAHRPEIDRDLDLVVLRALAKEPGDRYRSAQEMDRDLELVARGESVGSETEEAATMVLAGAGAVEPAAASQAVGKRTGPGATYGGGERYRAYESPVTTGRPWWPWLLGLGAILALAVAGYFLYDRVQEQIDSSKPVAVGDYQGIKESLAVQAIVDDGFEPDVKRLPNATERPGYVYDQDPSEGTRLAKDSIVTILVSSGKAKVRVPGVVGFTEADAVATITRAGLDANSVQINSEKEAGIVTAQDPKAGTVLVEGSGVRINVSKGPRPVAVPAVVGLAYDQAASQLSVAGFAVRRVEVDNDKPAGEVVDQNPPANSTARKGSIVTLSVSKGPTTVGVPDVTGADVETARATLRSEGFKVKVTREDTDDQSFDGLVVSQDPIGGSQAEPDATVTLVVARYVAPPEATVPTDTVETIPPP